MKKTIFAALLTVLFASSDAFAMENMGKAMDKVYGRYHEGNQCWILRDDYTYCMKIAAVRGVTDEAGNESVYLLASGDAIEDEGHVHAFSKGGRIGMIVYKSNDKGKVDILLAKKNVPAGSDGVAPETDALSIIQIGPSRWAWEVDDSGARQISSWTVTTLYAPYKKSIVPVLEFQTRGSTYNMDTETDVVELDRSITIDDTDENNAPNGFFPIEIEVSDNPQPDNPDSRVITPGNYKFTFNPAKRKYVPEPGSRMAIDLINQGVR